MDILQVVLLLLNSSRGVFGLNLPAARVLLAVIQSEDCARGLARRAACRASPAVHALLYSTAFAIVAFVFLITEAVQLLLDMCGVQYRVALNATGSLRDTAVNAIERVFSPKCKIVWLLKDIGSGGYGGVCEGVYIDGNGTYHKVAIKFPFQGGELAREKTVFRFLPPHPNIVRHFSGDIMLVTKHSMRGPLASFPAVVLNDFMVLELAPRTLRALVHEDRTPLKYCQWILIFLGILEGVRHMRDGGVAHLDINPRNILLDAVLTPMLTDFGCSRLDVNRNCPCTQCPNHHLGTFHYMAPERLVRSKRAEGFSVHKMDMFSVGVVMWECVTGREVASPKTQGDRFAMSAVYPERLVEIIHGCLCEESDARPNSRAVISSLRDMLRSQWADSECPRSAPDVVVSGPP